jgi:hypothetical protein
MEADIIIAAVAFVAVMVCVGLLIRVASLMFRFLRYFA